MPEQDTVSEEKEVSPTKLKRRKRPHWRSRRYIFRIKVYAIYFFYLGFYCSMFFPDDSKMAWAGWTMMFLIILLVYDTIKPG